MQNWPQVKPGNGLFKVMAQIPKVDRMEAREIGTAFTKLMDGSDVSYEFWQKGADKGECLYEFVVSWPLTDGATYENPTPANERIARILGNAVWTTLGDFREDLKFKVNIYSKFSYSTPVMVLNEDLFWTDFYPDSEELAESLGVIMSAGDDEKKISPPDPSL